MKNRLFAAVLALLMALSLLPLSAAAASAPTEAAIGYAQATREQALVIATRMVNNL